MRHDRHIFFTAMPVFPELNQATQWRMPQESRMQEGVGEIATTGIMIIIGTIVSPPLFAIAGGRVSYNEPLLTPLFVIYRQ